MLNTTAIRNPCAVEACEQEGRPKVCLYDGRYHHHGAIHYETAQRGKLKTDLTFRDDHWYWICSDHYTQLKAEFDAVWPTPPWKRP